MIAESRRRTGRAVGTWPAAIAGAAVATVVLGRALDAVRPADEASPLVIFTHLYALLMVAALLLLACAVGRSILRHLHVDGDSPLEHGVFAIGLGLGGIAAVVVCLGLVQVLTRPVLGIVVLLLAVLVRRDLAALLRGMPDGIKSALELRRSVQPQGRVLALLVPLIEILFAALLLRALVPPFENDVLTYHLQGPQRFLELGRIAPLPDIQQANMPLAVNMLYLLGMAFGSDELAGVLHVCLAGLAAAATFSLGRRFFGERVGWIAATTFLSTQLLLVFATVAFVDYGLALFDFLAVYSFVVWRENGRRGWLVLSGLLVGCALASKYLGAITALCLGAWLLAVVFRQRRELGLIGIIRVLVSYGLPAALVAAPWYVKNLVWFGNPVWPFLAANPNDFNMYLGSTTKFAGSEGIVGTLLLPVYLYTRGSVELPAGRPPLQLLAIPLYLVLPKHRVVTALAALAAVHLLAWSQGAHVLRYWLQALPEASIVAAYVLGRLLSSEGRTAARRHLISGLILLGLAFPTIMTLAAVLAEGPVPQFVGLESRQAFLDRKLPNYPLVTYLNEGHEPVTRVLMIGDNRSYYLQQPAWVDVSMEVFQSIVLAPDARTARARLAERDISHVMVNRHDLMYYVPIDPERRILTWWERFEAGRAGYLEPIATNEESTLYRVIP